MKKLRQETWIRPATPGERGVTVVGGRVIADKTIKGDEANKMMVIKAPSVDNEQYFICKDFVEKYYVLLREFLGDDKESQAARERGYKVYMPNPADERYVYEVNA